MLTPAPVSERISEAPISRPAECDLSVIIPLYNEEDNVEPLYTELENVLQGTGVDYEIIFVDDGSRDRSVARLRHLAAGNPRVVLVELRRNFGQTSAMSAGIDRSRGAVLVPMDADCQNDPHDIPALLAKLEEPPGYDVVSGWRKNRQDRWINRKLPSRIANWLIGRVTQVRLHDYGCTLKAYRREVLTEVGLYSELHRFLPALASWNGARISELVVNHRPRTRGVTKYNIKRTMRVLLDLVTVKFLGGYRTKPLYFFGKVALYSFIAAFVTLLVAVGQKFGYFGQPDGLHLNRNILVTLSALLVFLSVQCILLGITCELLVRIYHESRGKPTYNIRRITRFAEEREPSNPAKCS